MMYDVLALGGYCLDLIFTDLDAPPELGREVFSRKFAILPGGTYNAVTTLHRLGVITSWVANFGNDDFSQFVLDKARIEGLDCKSFVFHKKPLRNITVASSYEGDREFISYSDQEPVLPRYLRKVLDTQCRAVFIGGFYSGRLLHLAANHLKKHETLIIMDGNSSSGSLADQNARRTLRCLDVFLPNAREARRLVGQKDLLKCLDVLGQYTRTVVVKDGCNGAIAIQDGMTIHVPGIKVKCIDTTGAGDCFDAGFIKAILSGADLETCLMWGNIVGGLSTQDCGGTSVFIQVNDVKKTLKKVYGRKSLIL